MKKSHVLFPFLIVILLLFCFAKAQDTLDIYLFYGEGCPHCKKEQTHLKIFEKKYKNISIHRYEVYYNDDNMHLFGIVAKSLGADISGIPFLIIGEDYIVGFDEALTPGMIRNNIEKCLASKCSDPVREIILKRSNAELIQDDQESHSQSKKTDSLKEKIITIPFLGDINVYTFSLPALTVVMGFLDGFNPCAMWALIFLIGLLLGMKDKKRMWILGTAFIVASAFVYFLFMAAWLNLILLFGFVLWIRIGIGLLALLSGGYSIRDFVVNKAGRCELSENEKRQRIYAKLKTVISQHSLALSLGGIILLAFMVNLIEIVCSAGFPAIYTQVLSLSALPPWQYYSYIFLYIFFFMIDDLFVFVAAMITFEITGATTQYVRYARLVGGMVMILIGILLLFRPQWLMFG